MRSEKQPEAPTSPTVDARKHRYPFALVWTPIHPISWLAPYVGHCGLCDASGRVLDFAGPYQVGHDDMLFGWPTRYFVLEEQRECGSESWDPIVYELAGRYERQSYNFVSWNCHSLVASALNTVDHPRDTFARCFRGWTIIGVAWLFFTRARHLGAHGALRTWGGYASLWAYVIFEAVRQQSLQAVRSFLMLQAATLIGFLGWFSLLTLLRLDSQYGKCRMRAAGDTPTLGPVYPDSEDLPPYAGELTRSLLGGDEWEQPPPMRVDSFGDIVEDVPRGDS